MDGGDVGAAAESAPMDTGEGASLDEMGGGTEVPESDSVTAAPPAIPEFFEDGALPPEWAERKVRMKVNGEMVEIPLAKALEHARLGTAAFRKFDEAKQLREEATQRENQLRGLLDQARKSPLAFVRRFGPDAEDALMQELRTELRKQQMTPDERRAHDVDERERSLEERERRMQDEMQRREQAEKEAQIQASAEQWKRQLGESFTKELGAAGLSEAEIPEGIQRMADLVRRARKAGANIALPDIARAVADEMDRQFQARAGRLPPEVLHKRLGGRMEELRKLELAQLRQSQRSPTGADVGQRRPATQQSRPAPIASDQMSAREWTEYLNKQMRGG